MHVKPSSFKQSKTSDLLPATSNYWFSTHPAFTLSLSSLSLGSLPQAEVAMLVVAWLHTRFVIYSMLIDCFTDPHQSHMSRWRWTAAQWRFLAAVYCDVTGRFSLPHSVSCPCAMAVPEPMLSCVSVHSKARKPTTAAQRSLSFHSHKSQTLSTSYSCLQLNLGKTNDPNNIIVLLAG